MKGRDLFDYLKNRNFKLPEERVREIIYQMVLALQYLQSFGVIHRDIKLENIMMSDFSDFAIPKIIDFGLARVLGPSEGTIEPYGTLGYVAPEVLIKEPYRFTCDLWSLGCLTHGLLTGALPFDHPSP